MPLMSTDHRPVWAVFSELATRSLRTSFRKSRNGWRQVDDKASERYRRSVEVALTGPGEFTLRVAVQSSAEVVESISDTAQHSIIQRQVKRPADLKRLLLERRRLTDKTARRAKTLQVRRCRRVWQARRALVPCRSLAAPRALELQVDGRATLTSDCQQRRSQLQQRCGQSIRNRGSGNVLITY